jgi:hypothetical protein
MVGDYDVSAPLNASTQLREVAYVARLSTLVGFGVLTEPVTLEGFVPATISGQAQAPVEGDSLTFVGYSGELLPIGVQVERNATGWPGPALETHMWAIDYDSCSLGFGRDDLLCAVPLDYANQSFPCAGKQQPVGPQRV